jgi:predicted transcriptional regulator
MVQYYWAPLLNYDNSRLNIEVRDSKREENPPPGVVLKNIIARSPWLYPLMRAIFSTPGLTIEELKDTMGLKIDVIKRGVWWLKKYGLVEEKGGRLYIAQRFSKPIEELLLNTCSLGDTLILLLDEVYIVYIIRERRVEYWSIPAKYCREILRYENMVGSLYTIKDIAHILDVDESTAKLAQLLLNFIRKCRFHQTS